MDWDRHCWRKCTDRYRRDSAGTAHIKSDYGGKPHSTHLHDPWLGKPEEFWDSSQARGGLSLKKGYSQMRGEKGQMRAGSTVEYFEIQFLFIGKRAFDLMREIEEFFCHHFQWAL